MAAAYYAGVVCILCSMCSGGVTCVCLVRRFSPSRKDLEGVGRTSYEPVRPTEIDLLLLDPGIWRHDKDALSNHKSNYGLKDDSQSVIFTSLPPPLSSLSPSRSPAPCEG